MSTTFTALPHIVEAPTLPDVLPPRRERGRTAMFIYRYPTIAIGGVLLTLILLVAVFAPFLGTVDPTALAQATGRSAASVDVSALQPVAVTIETYLTDFEYRYGRCDGSGTFLYEAIRVIAVGTVIADRPPHRSTQAAFPHAAPTSGV